MATICLCKSVFATVDALREHATSLGHRIQCRCGTIFETEQALANHKRDVKSYHEVKIVARLDTTKPGTPLDRCGVCPNKMFASSYERDRHITDKHNTCPVCAQVFGEKVDRIRHQIATNHCYCPEHKMVFDGADSFAKHIQFTAHIGSFECTNCNRSFRSDHALDDHLASDGHHRVITAAAEKHRDARNSATKLAQFEEVNLRCEACDRTFKHHKAWMQHKQSLKHNPISELKCPLSKKCPGIFSSPSALLFHLESGTCRSGMTRAALNAVVYQHDNERHITSTAHAASVGKAAIANTAKTSVGPNSSASKHARSVSVHSASSSTTGGVPLYTPPETERSVVSVHSASAMSAGDGSVTPGPTIVDLGDEISATDLFKQSTDNTRKLEDPARFDEVKRKDHEIAELLQHAIPVSIYSEATSSSGIETPSTTLEGGGVKLSPSVYQISRALEDWSFLNPNPEVTQGPASIDGSSVETLTYDAENKRWPCHICSQTFRKKHDLVQHINSITHSPKIFHCPTDLPGLPGPPKPTVTFKTLSGLAQHVEAGSCKGGKATLGFIVGIFEKQIQAKFGTNVKLLKE